MLVCHKLTGMLGVDTPTSVLNQFPSSTMHAQCKHTPPVPPALKGMVSIYKPREHKPPGAMLQRVKSMQQSLTKPLHGVSKQVSKVGKSWMPKGSVGKKDTDDIAKTSVANGASAVDAEAGTNGAERAVELPPVNGTATTEHQSDAHTTVFSNTVEDIPMSQPSGGQNSTLPFMPVTLTFKDVRYCVPLVKKEKEEVTKDPAAMLELLKVGRLCCCGSCDVQWWICSQGITGAFRPGVLTALMGESGAGKTTLMDVLAGRKTVGTITGDIRVNGFPKDNDSFNRIAGYVEQTDTHTPELTVEEAVYFSARMRLPADVDTARVHEYADEIMELIELDTIAKNITGMPGQSGLSVEQRKRLSIGVELAGNPSLIFMVRRVGRWFWCYVEMGLGWCVLTAIVWQRISA